MKPRSYSLAYIADAVEGKVVGDPSLEIHHLATLKKAKPGDLSFLTHDLYKKYLPDCQATAVLLKDQDSTTFSGSFIIVREPALALAKVAALFERAPFPEPGVHPQAVVAPSAHVDPSARIGPGAVIEADAHIGADVIIGAQCYVGAGCEIKARTRLYPRVTLYYGVVLGEGVIVHSGAVIGADGFGYANDRGRWVKIPQIGSVIVGDGAEIGANTCIDRGAIDDTVIGQGVIIDNLVQVGHNAVIGDHAAMAGCAGIAGSTVIGKYCAIGGGACIGGHITLADKVTITGMGMVTRSIDMPGVYSSGTGILEAPDWRRAVVRFRQLEKLAKDVKQLKEMSKHE